MSLDSANAKDPQSTIIFYAGTCSADIPCRVSTLMVANSRSGDSTGPNSASSTWSSTSSTSCTTVGVRCFSAANKAGSSTDLACAYPGALITRTVSSDTVSEVDSGSRPSTDTSATASSSVGPASAKSSPTFLHKATADTEIGSCTGHKGVASACNDHTTKRLKKILSLLIQLNIKISN